MAQVGGRERSLIIKIWPRAVWSPPLAAIHGRSGRVHLHLHRYVPVQYVYAHTRWIFPRVYGASY